MRPPIPARPRLLSLALAVALFVGLLPISYVAAATAGLPGTALDALPAPLRELLAPTITATKRDALQVDNDSDGLADPGDTLRYTVTIANSGTSDATGVSFEDTVDSNTTVVPGSLRTTPLARNDSYSVTGNVRISVPDGASDLLANDVDLDGGTVTITAYDATSANGGTVAVTAATGSFSYDPPLGFEGTDSFTYTVTDDEGQSDSATVTLTVSRVIWFINNGAAPGGTGRLSAPFNSIAAFNSNAPDDPGDFIFVYEGSGPYSGAFVLLNNQQLIGQGVALSAVLGGPPAPFSDPLPPATAKPVLTFAGGTVITLGQNNTLRGFTVGDAAADISGSGFGTLTVSAVVLNGTGRTLTLINGTLAATFESIASTGSSGGAGLLLQQAAGTLTVTGGTTIANNPTGNGLTLQNNSAALSFGTTTVTGTGNSGVRLQSNSGAVSFGALNITPNGGQRAFHASGQTGVISSTGGAISATNAVAVEIEGVSAASRTPLNMQLTSVSGSTAANGIVLRNTTASGSPGGFIVNGDGSNTTVGGNGSGGTLTSMVGANGAIAGNGIYLETVTGVTLRRMRINGTNQNHGIRGVAVSNFTLDYSTVTGTNGNSAADDEGSIHLSNLTGSAAITGSLIEGGHEDNLRVVNTSGTLDRLVISGSTFGLNQTATGNNNLLIEAQNAGTVLNWTLRSSTIRGARSDWINAANNSGSTMDAVIGGPLPADGNSFSNLGADAHPGALAGGNRVVFGAIGPQTLDIRNNTLRGSKGEAIRVRGSGTASGQTGTVNARVRSNTIGDAAIANSGSSEGSGIFIFGDGGSDMNVAVTSNTIRQYNNHGISLFFGDEINPGSAFNVTVTGNSVNTPGTINSDFNGIHLNNGTVGATDDFTTCADIGGAGALANSVAGSGQGTIPPNNNDIRLRQRQSTTVRLPGYGGAASDNAAVQAYLLARNNASTAAASNTVPTGGGFVGGASCTQPSVPALAAATPTQRVAEPSVQGGGSASAEAAFVPLERHTAAREQGGAAAHPSTPDTAQRDGPTAPLADVALTIGTLSPGESLTISFDVLIANPVAAGVNNISNQGSVSGGNFPTVLTNDPDTGAPNDPTLTPLQAVPDLTLTKSDGGASAAPGGTIAYTLGYANAGNQGATGVTLSETVPANTTFSATASSPGWSCANGAPAGTSCTLAIGGLAGGGANGSRTFAVTVVNPVPAGITQISNSASVSDDGANGTDPTPPNNSASDATPVLAQPDLTLSKSDGGATTIPGGTVTYTLGYANVGNQGATGLTLTETVPANTTFNPGASTPGWACAPDNDAGSTCTLAVGALAGGGGNGSATFAVTVDDPLPLATTQLSNAASVADDGANGADPTPPNNNASDTTPIRRSDLQLDKSGDPIQIDSGDTVTYTLLLTNGGPSADTNVVVTDTLPLGATYQSDSCSTSAGSGNERIWTVGSLGNGAIVSCEIAVTINSTAPQVCNEAAVSGDNLDPTPANNEATACTLLNAPPILSAVAITSPVNENGTATLTGSMSEPDNDPLTLVVTWGDGSTDTYSYPAGTTAVTETHQYLDDDPSGTPSDSYSVGLTLSDDSGGSDTATTSVTVNNVAPTLSGVTLTPSVSENGTATLAGTVSDPGTLDTFTLDIAWGDGVTETVALAAGATGFSRSHTYLDDDPSGTASDTYSVGVTLSDDDTGSDSATRSITVNNVAPTLSGVTLTPSVNENGSATLAGTISDPGTLDTFTLDIAWGDGVTETVALAAGATGFSRSHTYLDDDPSGTASDAYSVALTVTDDDSGSASTTRSITVNNVAPTLSGVTLTPSVNENGTATLAGSISDPGTLDTFALDIAWGDGVTETVSLAAGATSFSRTHTYLDDDPSGTPSDTYSVGVTLSDDDSGSASTTRSITVNNIAPDLGSLTATPPVISEGGVITLTGTISDPSPADSFTLVVDWGDGESDTFTYPAGATSFSETHMYSDGLGRGQRLLTNYTISATLSDDDTGSDSASVTVTVDNSAPTLSAISATDVAENGFTTLTGSISDPSPADSFTLVVAWGDGITDTYAYPAGATSFSETHMYLDDDPSGTPADDYTIALTLTDSGGASDTASTTVTVSNVAPTLGALALSPTIAEGESATLSATISDPGTLDSFTLLVAWGDGITDTYAYPAGTSAIAETHLYVDDDPTGTPSDPYSVSLTLSDDDTGSDSASAVVTVNNVVPTLDDLIATPLVISETQRLTLTGTIDDPSPVDSFTLVVDWSDGITDTYSYPAGTTTFAESHTYNDGFVARLPQGTFTIVATVSDDDGGGTTSDSVLVTVNNLPPELSNVAATDVVENGTSTLTGLLSDPSPADSFTLEVEWGDGVTDTFSYPAGTSAFTETHRYLDDDPTGTPSDNYTVTLTLSDDDGGSALATTMVMVDNVAPMLGGVAMSGPIAENGSSTLSGTISDPGTRDSFTLAVDWGDGITDTYSYPAGTTTFSQAHTYLDDDPTGTPSDTYSVTLTLTDDDTGAATAATSVTVNNVAPTVNAGPDTAAAPGTPVTFAGTFSDPGTLDTHTIVWDFGDGSGTSGTLTPSHSYTQPGTYAVTLTVTDDDGGVGTDSLTVMVSEPTAVTLGELEGAAPSRRAGLAALGGLAVLVGLTLRRRRNT